MQIHVWKSGCLDKEKKERRMWHKLTSENHISFIQFVAPLLKAEHSAIGVLCKDASRVQQPEAARDTVCNMTSSVYQM